MERSTLAVGHQGIKTMPGHEFIDFIANLCAELKGVIGPLRVHRNQLRTGLAQDIQGSVKRCAVFDRFGEITVHIPASEPDAPPRQQLGRCGGSVIQHQGDLHHHRLCGVDTTQGDQ
ncbi:hypothetical protein [Pseudomonas costantinii]|uniref:hypothetical protein n=1 Tax=Pseudomonas costantinii TaxID=168469 RepID=UPI0015A21882|nr:hypothetical protein [Pseudomonas costantinii]